MNIRINKYLSEAGYCSRREADRLIENKLVTVNGKVPDKGLKVSHNDIVKVNGEVIKRNHEFVYIAFNKPKGIICTTDTSIKDSIVDYISYTERIFHVGRLDKDSNGLIFMTNDRDIVNKILRAGNNHEKEYVVTVDKPVTDKFLVKMRSGVPILGTVTKKCKVEQEGKFRFRITLTQGLNRQIRRMCEYLGYDVKKLKRVRIMNVNLGKLAIGKWRYLTEKEMKIINEMVSESVKTEEASVD